MRLTILASILAAAAPSARWPDVAARPRLAVGYAISIGPAP